MKKIAVIAICVLGLAGLYACNNSIDKVFDSQTVIEFQPAVLNAVSAGRTYPLLSSGNSVTAGATINAQINLVGKQRDTPLTVQVSPDPVGTTAAASSYSLANGGAVTFPPMSSTAAVTLTISRATSATATLANIVLVIDSTNTAYKASQNYKRIGYSFRQ